jgi:SAM-dependent methyltransferase
LAKPRTPRPTELSPSEDAYGSLLVAHLERQERTKEIVERDDGFISVTDGPESYFAPFRRWPVHQRRALRFVRGRVLDVGAGAGRVALELQDRGHEVVAMDISPGAVEVCRRRGVRDVRVMRFEDVDASLGRIDTVLMFGNNFGLFGSRSKAGRMLRRLDRLTAPAARIVAEIRDTYSTDDPVHLGYHERNRRRGRMPGQLRIRVRHRLSATPWFDYLIVSPDELRELLAGSGWQVAKLIEGEAGMYAVVLEKTR